MTILATLPATFLEGVESISLACSLVMLVPLLALVLASPAARGVVASAYVVGAALLMWARAARWWEWDGTGAVVVIIAAAVAATYGLAARGPRGDGSLAAPVAAGVIGGAVAGWLWRPCVGEQLAEVLNTAETAPARSLMLMTAYVAGTLLPALMLAALATALPRSQQILAHPAVRGAGLAVGGVYALTVLIGRYDDLVGELFRISSS